jgi:hypothetical protein
VKLKLDDAGHAVLKDGMPVYTHDDGTDAPFDVVKTLDNIKALRGEAKTHREAKEAAEERLKTYTGIDDPKKALEALETVGKLDAKRLIDAGQVDTFKAEINKAWETKYGALEQERDGLRGELYNEKVGGAFARSKFIAEKLVLPPDLAQAAFGKHFKVEGGKVKAVDAAGSPIFSKKSPGSEADFEEAVEILVDAYPRKDSILKADNKGGSGAPNNPGGQGAQRTGAGNLGGTREERTAAIRARFPDLARQ